MRGGARNGENEALWRRSLPGRLEQMQGERSGAKVLHSWSPRARPKASAPRGGDNGLGLSWRRRWPAQLHGPTRGCLDLTVVKCFLRKHKFSQSKRNHNQSSISSWASYNSALPTYAQLTRHQDRHFTLSHYHSRTFKRTRAQNPHHPTPKQMPSPNTPPQPPGHPPLLIL